MPVIPTVSNDDAGPSPHPKRPNKLKRRANHPAISAMGDSDDGSRTGPPSSGDNTVAPPNFSLPSVETFSFSAPHSHSSFLEESIHNPRRKIPRISSPEPSHSTSSVPQDFSMITNSHNLNNDPDTWLSVIAEMATYLSNQLTLCNLEQFLSLRPTYRHKLSSLQHIIHSTNGTLGACLDTSSLSSPMQINKNDGLVNAIKELTERMRSQEMVINHIQEAVSVVATKQPPTLNAPLPTKPPTVNTPLPTKRLFSEVATAAANKPSPKTTTNSKKPTQSKLKGPLRYVVRFQGHAPPEPERILNSERAMIKLNACFNDLPTAKGKITAIAVVPKGNGNYIVTFSDSSPPHIVEEHKAHLAHVLAPGNPHVIVSRDEPWVRLIVHNISLLDTLSKPRTEQSLTEALMYNSALKNVQITQPPRWISSPDKLVGKSASAFTFSFVDKSTSIVPAILDGPFHMFGKPVRVARWEEKPKPAQCKKCWRLTHPTRNCTSPVPRCRKCGKAGREDQHHIHCDECKRNPANDGVCNHISCANCHQHDHCADDAACPKRSKTPHRSSGGSHPSNPTPSQPDSMEI
jgi:hypothetical protein